MMQKLSENVLDKFSMDFLRNQVLKNAYGNDDTVIAVRDPRILLVWYLFFGLVPWFVNDLPFLLGCFLLVMVTTVLAKVAGLVLLLFAVGVFSQTGYLLIATWIFGIALVVMSGAYTQGWMHAKFALVLAMSGIHGWLSRMVKDFAADRNVRSPKFYRVLNEVPTLLMILIVILVVVKPF